jgi:hypothetical protein
MVNVKAIFHILPHMLQSKDTHFNLLYLGNVPVADSVQAKFGHVRRAMQGHLPPDAGIEGIAH